MPWYRRARQDGGTFFFTLVTENRAPLFAEETNRRILREAFHVTRAARPFSIDALVLLPDHLHLLTMLPNGDGDYSSRLSQLKSHFTRMYLAVGGPEQPRSDARINKRRRGVWQRWFWERRIRDDHDHAQHVEYILCNAMKHNLATCPHAWPWSSFQQFVDDGWLKREWRCVCDGRSREAITDPPWATRCEP